MEKVDFSSLNDCLNVDSTGVSYEDALPDLETKTQKLREHFLEFLPEGYSAEEIEKMSLKQLKELEKCLDESHCF